MSCIQEFLRAYRVEGSEVWFGEVCFGSPGNPWLRVPVQEDSAERLHHSIARAERHMFEVLDSLGVSIETSRRVMKELGELGGTVVDNTELAAVVERLKFLQRLLTELSESAAAHSVKYHPAVLIKWRDILEKNLGSGDPSLRVRVEIVYVL
jgi:hypothetical protein